MVDRPSSTGLTWERIVEADANDEFVIVFAHGEKRHSDSEFVPWLNTMPTYPIRKRYTCKNHMVTCKNLSTKRSGSSESLRYIQLVK